MEEKTCKNCQKQFTPEDATQSVCEKCKKTLYSESLIEDTHKGNNDGFFSIYDYQYQ